MFEDLDICVCTIDHGVSLIKKRKNSDYLNLNLKNFKELKYGFYKKNYSKIMNLKSFDEAINFSLDRK